LFVQATACAFRFLRQPSSSLPQIRRYFFSECSCMTLINFRGNPYEHKADRELRHRERQVQHRVQCLSRRNAQRISSIGTKTCLYIIDASDVP